MKIIHFEWQSPVTPGIWWRGLCPQHSPSTHNDKHSCLWPSGSIPVFGIACFFLHSSQLDDDVYIVNWVKRGWKWGAEGPLFVCIPFSPSHSMSKDSFFNWIQLMFPSIATWEGSINWLLSSSLSYSLSKSVLEDLIMPTHSLPSCAGCQNYGWFMF